MKSLLIFLKPYTKESIFGPVFKLMEAGLELIVPLIVAVIIDKGIPAGNKGYIAGLCGILVLLGLVGLACSVTAQYFAAKASAGFATHTRRALFEHIGRLSFSQTDALGSDTLITRLTGDLNQVQSAVNLVLRLLLRSPFVVFGAMIMAFTIDFKSALVFAVVIPALLIAVFVIMLSCIPIYNKAQQQLDSVLGKTRENLEGTRVIRAFCKEPQEKEEFNLKSQLLYKIQIFAGRISALMNPATLIIINIGIALLIYTGAIRVNAGKITQGQVVALYNYMSQILVELIKFAGFIISTAKAIACGNRIQSVLEITPDLQEKTAAPQVSGEYAVEFNNVFFSYRHSSGESLSGIDFKVKRGQTVGIIGGTGSGKTTLVNLIPRFYDVTSGSVLVDGADVRDYSFKALREKIGLVPQKAMLFSGSIRENLLWGNENAGDDELYAALEIARADTFVKAKPGGLDFFVEQGGRNLSGGQRQRLTIARALVKKPEILILDDSFSALDYATDAALRKALKETDFIKTVFIVSQRASSVRQADLIIVLDDGKAVGIGTSEQLLSSCEVYREIYETQYKKEGERNA